MARRSTNPRMEYAVGRLESWGDWMVIGGWDYLPLPEFDYRWRIPSACEHSNPVLQNIIANERKNKREESTDLIIREMGPTTRRILAYRYIENMNDWSAIMYKALERFYGEGFRVYAGELIGSAKFVRKLRDRATRMHTEACEHMLDRLDSARIAANRLNDSESQIRQKHHYQIVNNAT